MPNLLMLKGLQASGKSTFAKEQVALSKGRMKRVNRDSLREMIDPEWSNNKETQIIAARNALVDTFLNKGFDVIVDDTNLAPVNEANLRSLGAQRGATFKLVDFTDVPLETCLERDRKRPNGVGSEVILDMYYKYLFKPAEPPEHDGRKIDCIICDIDGTIAEKSPNRGWFDEDERLLDDTVRGYVVAAVAQYHVPHRIFLSGRSEKGRVYTEEWLKTHIIPQLSEAPWSLIMRNFGDTRPDYVVKRELHDKWIAPDFNVLAIWDDRPSVCRSAWESMGYGDRLFRVGTMMREF